MRREIKKEAGKNENHAVAILRALNYKFDRLLMKGFFSNLLCFSLSQKGTSHLCTVPTSNDNFKCFCLCITILRINSNSVCSIII